MLGVREISGRVCRNLRRNQRSPCEEKEILNIRGGVWVSYFLHTWYLRVNIITSNRP